MNKNDKQALAGISGVILLLVFFVFFHTPINIGIGAMGIIYTNLAVTLLVKFYSAFLCSFIAKDLNRSSIGWGVFGFLIPAYSLIIIAFMKEIERIEETEEDDNNNIITPGSSMSILENYSMRGNEKFINRDYSGAIKDFTTVIVLNSNDAESYYKRGLAKVALNYEESAMSDFQRAKELGYNKAETAINKYCKQ